MSADGAAGRMEQLRALVDDVEARGGEVAEASRALLRAVLDLHEAALARALELAAAQGEPGRALVNTAMAADPLVASLLLLHGLHPDGIEARVAACAGRRRRRAPRSGRRAPSSYGVHDGVVRVAITGASARALVEDALIAAAPDAEGIEIEELSATALLPAERLLSHAARREMP